MRARQRIVSKNNEFAQRQISSRDWNLWTAAIAMRPSRSLDNPRESVISFGSSRPHFLKARNFILQFIRNVLTLMSRNYPSPQNAVNIFEEGWVSNLPDVGGLSIEAGNIGLFNDDRIRWAQEQTGSFKGLKILELGPLEAGHSYMLQQMGADNVLAIEANSRSYLKCLIVKEIYSLEKCTFLLGDFVEYMKTTPQTFDFCLASGVLYHMQDPLELLALIARVSDRTMIWTQYYDREVIQKHMPYWKRLRFSSGQQTNYQGFVYTRYKRRYGLGLRSMRFLGGTAAYSSWMSLQDIVSGLKHFGFKTVDINFHHPDHANGPAVCLFASK